MYMRFCFCLIMFLLGQDEIIMEQVRFHQKMTELTKYLKCQSMRERRAALKSEFDSLNEVILAFC